jgi:hypothetical protein
VGAGDVFGQATRIVVRPTGHGKNYSVEVSDQAGSTVATCDPDGTIRDAAGTPLLSAPVRWAGRGDKPTDAGIEIADAGASPLGTARVVKYGVGPRAKKATIEVTDAQGAQVLRLEPRDKRGEELALTADDSEIATVAIEQVKAGFLRKARVYTVEIAGAAAEPLRPLAFATVIRYDVLLNAVAAASARDRD